MVEEQQDVTLINNNSTYSRARDFINFNPTNKTLIDILFLISAINLLSQSVTLLSQIKDILSNLKWKALFQLMQVLLTLLNFLSQSVTLVITNERYFE